MYLAWMTVSAALVSIFNDWYLSRDIDINEGDLVERRLIAWGTCHALSGDPQHDYRYFTLVIPFANSWQRDFSRGPDAWAWAELVICRFAGKWRKYWMIR